MHIPKSIVVAIAAGFIALSVCVVISTLAVNQFRKDRAFMLQHCTLNH